MYITVVGAGYVGLSTALLLASKHRVHIVDIDEKRINMLEAKFSPISCFQDQLEAVHSRLTFGTTHKYDPEIVFCCVDTPSGVDGRLDMSRFGSAVDKCPKNTIFVQRSTCMPGTAEKYWGLFDHYIVMPEFLRAEYAWEDTINIDRIIIGFEHADDIIAVEDVKALFYDILKEKRDTSKPMRTFVMSCREAEFTKLIANSFLATKISFASMVSMLGEREAFHAEKVLEAVGADDRIGTSMFRLDGGFGGACLPKDTLALSRLCDDDLLYCVLEVNDQVKGC